MSSSEAENFDIDNISGSDYESDDFVPKKKVVRSMVNSTILTVVA